MEFNLMEGTWGGCEGRARQSHDSLCGYTAIWYHDTRGDSDWQRFQLLISNEREYDDY